MPRCELRFEILSWRAFVEQRDRKDLKEGIRFLPSCCPIRKTRPFGPNVWIKYRLLWELCELRFKFCLGELLWNKEIAKISKSGFGFCRVVARFERHGHLVPLSG